MPGFPERNRQFVRMMLAQFLGYSAMVMPLSTLSLYVVDTLGMSNLLAGFAASAAFFVTLTRRKPSGDLADRRGGKHCFLNGCLWYSLGGAVCLGAASSLLPTPLRYAALVAGRMLLGYGESLANIGMVHWSVGVMGLERSGRVLATIGMSMYAAVAVGGQAGFALFSRFGFASLMGVCILSPLAAAALVRGSPEGEREEVPATKPSLREVLSRIWRLSLPAGFHAVGFAVLGAFLAKTFVGREWAYAGWGLTCYGIGFVVMRLCAGNLPDRLGGLPVAAASGVVEMSGLYLLWLAPGPTAALFGSFLTGAGCSMIFPSLGMEITRATPARLRGAALSSFTLFQDVAYCFAAPAAGLFADRLGDGVAYLFAALAATVGTAMVVNLRRKRAVAAANEPIEPHGGEYA